MKILIQEQMVHRMELSHFLVLHKNIQLKTKLQHTNLKGLGYDIYPLSIES